MKFCNCEVKTDGKGFRFVRNDVMVTDKETKCLICGSPSKYVEVVSEGHFCSEECVDIFYKGWAQKFENMQLE